MGGTARAGSDLGGTAKAGSDPEGAARAGSDQGDTAEAGSDPGDPASAGSDAGVITRAVSWTGARAADLFASLLLPTMRVERRGEENYLNHRWAGKGVVFVFRHQHMLPLLHLHRGEGIVVLASEHRDGEIVARALTRRGFGVIRGSSTRGGSRALRSLLAAARAGSDLAVTPDGPRGPAGAFKPGVLVAAQLSGAPVIPIAVDVAGRWEAPSWDRLVIPRPFSRVRVTYLPSRTVPTDAGRAELATMAARIASEIADACSS